MLTLKQSLQLGGQCLLAWLDPERQLFPAGGYEVAHDAGRWWDAMLRLEAATGEPIPAELEAAMLRNLQALLANPDGLLLNLADEALMGREPFINPHNFREGMLALHALVRYRGSAWAAAAGHRLLQTLDRCFQPDGRFDYTRLACWGKLPLTEDPCHLQPEGAPWFDATANSGRAIEAIVWFYEATGDRLALDVADRFARHHLANTVHADGSPRWEILDPENVGHNHSYLGTLRSLLLFGLLTGQHEYVEAVAATYRRSVLAHNVTECGWTPHDLGKTRFPNDAGDPVGETASCGDVAQIALWLALRAGQTELLDDVERLVRSRLLPAQITPLDAEDSANADVSLSPRQLGGWGSHAQPYTKGCILDVAAAVMHTLADIYGSIATRGGLGLAINLHLTADTPLAEVVSVRETEALLTVRPYAPDNVLVRMPAWVPRGSVQLSVNGSPCTPQTIGPWLFVPRETLRPGSRIEFRHALPTRTTTETWPSGRSYRLRWRGDQVVAVAPRDTPLAVYPADEG